MKTIFAVIALSMLSVSGFAQGLSLEQSNPVPSSALDELNPHDPEIEEKLREMDEAYERETGKSPFLEIESSDDKEGSCYRMSCKVFLDIRKSTQSASIYVDGVLKHSVKVSTGIAGFLTPDFDRKPNGRIYDKYTSSKYPGGDYNGLGNMPYAVFISGGFAVHGTGRGNWPKLGTKASHGCIRMHPDNGKIFNRLVRSVGISQTWITVRN